MKDPVKLTARQRLDVAALERSRQHYILRLYVTGSTAKSLQAIDNIRRICREHLEGRYQLEVVDLYEQPASAEREQIIAAPTLIRELPMPLRRLVGNLSDKERVMVGLDLEVSE